MALPTFIGIGVPRAGTTWLRELLAEHPAVFVPSRRNEIFYFDLYYDRGLNWYQKFFPSDSGASAYQAIGEITPFYLYGPACPERIAQLRVEKLILILRNPVDRAWSYYAHMMHNGAFWGSFEEFLRRPEFAAVEHGYYGRYLRRYLEHFRLDQMLVLVFEEAIKDTSQTKQRIAEFLGVDPAGFSPNAGERIVNASFLPRARRVYSLAFGLSRILRRLDLDFVVNAAKRMGVKEMFGSGGNVAPMLRETGKWLSELYDTDICEVEQILGMSLAIWRQGLDR
jgi:Sulfotransferase domain